MDMTSILPIHDSVSQVWFDGVTRDILLLQRDPATGKVQMYPRARVAGFPEREPEWVEASGKGKLHSFTVVEKSVHREFRSLAPFVVALVDLEEGVRMTAWIVDTPMENLHCDMPLRVVFREIHSGLKMPCFVGA